MSGLTPLRVALAMLPAVSPLGGAERPNIVFILADDLGYTDVNAYAARATGMTKDRMFYETPNIDRLVDGGMAFSQAYAYQLCSPTRSCLLTGIDAPKLGVTTATPPTARTYYNQAGKPPAGYVSQDVIHWGDAIDTPQSLLNGSSLIALPAGAPDDEGRDVLTFAEALPDYRSAFLGKWHVGGHGAMGHQPQDQGFEPLAYFDTGGSAFKKWRGIWNRRKLLFPKTPQKELLWGMAGEPTGEDYLTDDLSVRAERFIRSHHENDPQQPFLLYLCHFAVHAPIEAKQEDIDYFKEKPTRGWNGHHDPVYAGMIRSLDDSVGRIMATLEDLDIADNTLVIFMSDNGGIGYTTAKGETPTTSNAPLKGGKAMLYEGGIRVPLVFHWPRGIPAGQWSDVPVSASDLFPTIVQAGGVDPGMLRKKNPIDGESLFSLFNDPGNKSKGYSKDTFVWHYPFNVVPLDPDDGFELTPRSAIRKGDFKLIFDWTGRVKLYDIRQDRSETQNLAEQRPELARSLFRELNDWLDANVAVKYMPALNPEYQSMDDPRIPPFVDLRRHLLGPDRAIRSAQGDPRLREHPRDGF